MNRIYLPQRAVLATIAIAIATATFAAGVVVPASAAPSAHAARAQKLLLRHTSLGNILVDASGFTLYRFSKDTQAKNTCLTVKECSTTWPALTSSGQPTAGPGVKSSLISTIKLSGGTRQVTYAGHPLYRYAAAGERAETGYAGVKQFGGTWLALSASGSSIK